MVTQEPYKQLSLLLLLPQHAPGVKQMRKTKCVQLTRFPHYPPSSVDSFDFKFRVSSTNTYGSLRVVSGGTDCDDYTTDLSGLVSVPYTGAVANLRDIRM